MMQFLNNIFSNINIINFIYLLSTLLEIHLIITLLLLLFNIKSTQKQRITYIICTLIISESSSNILPSPFNVIINYICMILTIKIIFKINLIKACSSLVVTAFIFGVLNTLIQHPYLTICNISFNTFLSTPKYRIPYLIIFYSLFSPILPIFL